MTATGREGGTVSAGVKTATKLCVHPGHEGDNPLPLAGFNKDASRLDGLFPWCRDCCRRARSHPDELHAEKHRNQARRWHHANPAKVRAKTIRRMKENAALRQSATRLGKPWTPGELRIAAREDLTASQAAVMTGRTVFAVNQARTRVRRRPGLLDGSPGSRVGTGEP